MKKLNFRKIMAAVMSLTIMTALVPTGFAAVVSEKYNKTYIESFDDANTVFGDNGIIEYGQNADDTYVSIVDNTKQGGKYLQINSSDTKDVQVNTKQGVLNHDVTVVDMVISASAASDFPRINLRDKNGKIGKQSYGILTYVGDNSWRAYDLNDENLYVANESGNKWIPVRIILDSINKTVTINVYGTQKSISSVIEGGWDKDSAYLNFQAAVGSAMMIDDLVISDGTYMSDVYMSYDFEHSSKIKSETSNGETGGNFFYGINKKQNPVVVYEPASEDSTYNSYLDISNAVGNTVHTNTTLSITAGRPVVIEFRLKTDSTSNVNVNLKKDTLQAGLFTITNGVVTEGSKTVNVADGKFHTYRAVFKAGTTAGTTGYSISKLVDNQWIGTATNTSGSYEGTGSRIDFIAAAGAACGLDDLTIYFPQQPKLMCDFKDKTDVSTDTVIELVSNTQINASSASKVTITANGVPVNFTTSSNGNKNSYIFNIEGGLKEGTTYVLNTCANGLKDSGLKDMFDQFYNDEITFTTITSVEASTSYTIDGTTPAEGKFTAGTMSLALNVKANTAKGADVTSYVAQYNANNTLIKASPVKVTLSEIGENSKTESVEISNNAETVKIFVWDNDMNSVNDVITLKK